MNEIGQINRVSSGGQIDRTSRVEFTFNGKLYYGCEGDTLASALLANGVRTVARSFKYGRPRGIVAAGAEEPNAIVQLGEGEFTIPNMRATQVELYDGLVARSVTGWPSLRFDFLGLLGFFSWMMPPGFYYKTFKWPKKFWKTYESIIRKAAGLGRAPTQPDPDTYDKMHHHCDVLVVGGGPAGLNAAFDAAESGAKVMLVDEQSEFGGGLLHSNCVIDGKSAPEWTENRLRQLEKFSDVELLKRSTAFGYYDHNIVQVVERRTDHRNRNDATGSRQRLHSIRAEHVVLATGAIERPIVFANNDLPGVMLASAISTYLVRYGVAAGSRLVLFTSNDGAYQAALDWHSVGREVAAIVDTRSDPQGTLVNRARDCGIDVIDGSAVIEAKGSSQVKSACIAAINPLGTEVLGVVSRIACDVIATSGGWSPAIHLSSHTGARPKWSDDVIGFTPGDSVQNETSVGAARGVFGFSDCLVDGATAGARIAQRLGHVNGKANYEEYSVNECSPAKPQAVFISPHTKKVSRAKNQFVDMQLDVTAAAIELAAREGYRSVEHVKRYTALGFGTDQGKLGNVNGMAILANALGQTIAETGTTTFRPAYTPTTFGAIAGRSVGELFDPERWTAMHEWHQENGADWENVGQWKRPWYYAKPDESMQDAVHRECLAVRNSVGIMDASTLGKIDIQGADAAEFITRIYTNSYLKLAPGKCRYGVMLKEDGMIFDDGVTACIGENHYLMFTTTGGAAAVLAWLELWHQTEWPELDVFFTSVTDHWTTATVAGPMARKVLEKLCTDIDLSSEKFKFMDWRDGTVAGVKARIFRISFSGELSIEVNVPAHYGRYIWQQLIEAGKEYGITPYGTETMHILRAEKGFIIVGQDTDGSVTPHDANMSWVVGKNKAFSFIGKRSLERTDSQRAHRKQLVGLKTLEPSVVLPEGAQVVNSANEPIPMKMQGHVTSSYFSPVLDRSIAMALVKGGLSRIGEVVFCPLANGTTLAAEITSSVFYDPDGARHIV